MQLTPIQRKKNQKNQNKSVWLPITCSNSKNQKFSFEIFLGLKGASQVHAMAVNQEEKRLLEIWLVERKVGPSVGPSH